MEVFIRDGFVDRYNGERLLFPGTLRLLSLVLPEVFPAHPNWKMSESHIMYWELFPTIDHIIPISRGGKDEISNWVTTSMLRNQAKSNWTLDELGWELCEPGRISDWDGMTSWFLNYTQQDLSANDHAYIKQWARIANSFRGRLGRTE